MPKMKTNKAAARRFKITGTGKILRKQAGKRHINEWMSPSVKRNLRGWAPLDKTQEDNVKELFPYQNTFAKPGSLGSASVPASDSV